MASLLNQPTAKLWGGRFSMPLDPLMEKFNQSINLDKRMYKADIKGSKAYANSLVKAGIISGEERDQINDGLEKIEKEWDESSFELQAGDEDIHTANERRLKELCGAKIGGKLHTGRSRNDQVVTDMKLWLLNELDEIERNFVSLLEAIRERAKREIGVLMPGYTHLQRAQPVRWSHWLMSHCWSFYNDMAKIKNLRKEINFSPLGSGALAGNPFNIDRKSLADELGFDDCTQNSMQTVADRDFVAEFLFWASLSATHFSKLAEDLIIFSTKEFGFVKLSESYSTGSSLMPQKRNPDSLELIRGKSGVIIGQCSGFLTVLKGLPSTYNKDLQNDKSAMFDVSDDINDMIKISLGLISTLKVDEDRCMQALSTEMLATDVAYYLVRKGIPFRDAHEISGLVVKSAEDKGCQLSELSVDEMKRICKEFDNDVMDIWDYNHSVEQYISIGGTSSSSVLQQISKMESKIGPNVSE